MDLPYNKDIDTTIPRLTNWKSWKQLFGLDEISEKVIPFFVHGSQGEFL
jgi:hypothetical protein